MIAVRTFFKSTSTRKPRASKVRPGESAGDLVRGLESLHGRVPDLGATVVVGRASRKSLVATVHAKSTVGSSSVVTDASGAEPATERECGA